MVIKYKHIEWSNDKNQLLITQRGVSFSYIVDCIASGYLVDDIAHRNSTDYAHQRILIVNIDNYIREVPYVIHNKDTIFLKTAFPSRTQHAKYFTL